MTTKKRAVTAKETTRRITQAKAAKTPKALKLLTADQRSAIDPLAQQVNSMRRQAHAAGVQLDMMMALIYPKWREGNLQYDPGTGEIRPVGEVAPSASAEEVNAPVQR